MVGLEYITPAQWADYELIDSGDGQKLERFGEYVLSRPEPQAVWHPSLSQRDWNAMAHAAFHRRHESINSRGGDGEASFERGEWRRKPEMPDRWWVRFDHGGMSLRMRLGMTAFKHVGIFPEQTANWIFTHDQCKRLKKPKVLNLFAYTGGATLAAAAAGAAVTHVDSVKQVVAWARENAEASKLDGIRWIVDDALKFVQREVRRGNRYDGIILDPPAYGRGPDGEKWILERDIMPLLEACGQLLSERGFVVFNLYSMGLSALVARTAAHRAFGTPASEQFGEFSYSDRADLQLPLGVYYRMIR